MKAQRKALAVRSVLFLCGLISVCGPNVRAQTEESTKTWEATSTRGVSTEKPAAGRWNSFHNEARAARGVAKSAFYPSVGVTTSAERLRERVAAFNPGVNAPTFHPVELNN